MLWLRMHKDSFLDDMWAEISEVMQSNCRHARNQSALPNSVLCRFSINPLRQQVNTSNSSCGMPRSHLATLSPLAEPARAYSWIESNTRCPRLTAAMILLGSFVQMKGFGLALVSAMKLWMASLSSWRERKTPRLRRPLDRSATG
jgi:hypothetical protein